MCAGYDVGFLHHLAQRAKVTNPIRPGRDGGGEEEANPCAVGQRRGFRRQGPIELLEDAQEPVIRQPDKEALVLGGSQRGRSDQGGF